MDIWLNRDPSYEPFVSDLLVVTRVTVKIMIIVVSTASKFEGKKQICTKIIILHTTDPP